MEGVYKKTENGVDTFYCEHHKAEGSVKIESTKSIEINSYKIKELFPLLLVILGIALFSFVRQFGSIDWMMYMMDFMGIFLLSFGLLKLVDLEGFAQGFASYDLIAKRFVPYGYMFPFIEIGLGFMYLAGIMLLWQNVLVLILAVLGMYSAYKVIVDKKQIRCVCLGTLFHIPMTWATFIENFLMALMIILMLLFPMNM